MKEQKFEKEMPLVGKVVEESKEELESIKEKQAKKKLEIMDALDEIDTPLMVTVINDPEPFEYRNRAFWEAFQRRDYHVRNMLTDYLDSKKKVK